MDFSELEASEGLRWSWNAWPCSRKQAEDMVIPLAVMCCPLAPIQDLALLPYAPLSCSACRALLNPYARLDSDSPSWTCPFCFHVNPLPPSYQIYTQHSLPAELFPTHTCVEYILPPSRKGQYAVTYPHYQQLPPPAPAFLFVLDTALLPDDLSDLKKAVAHTLSLLPDDALVGVVSFGSQVQVHDLGFTNHCTRAVVFAGERELPFNRIQELLGTSFKSQRHLTTKQGRHSRFLVPFCDCEFNFTAILDDLQPEALKSDLRQRPERASGAALAVAISLLMDNESISGSRILLFVGGPVTLGPGRVVAVNLEESMRTHRDLTRGRAHHYRKAEEFYKRIEDALVDKGIVLDLFACSLDQVGIHEVRWAVEASNGLLVMAETFGSNEFKKSLQQLFNRDAEGHLNMGFNSTMEMVTSQKVTVSRALGPCSPMSRKKNGLVDMEGTNTWKLCTLTDKTHLAFVFELSSQSADAYQPGTAFIVQFITKYHKSNGQVRVRVMTTARRWIDGSQTEKVVAGFDQEAAAAIMSRLAVSKAVREDISDVITWLDNMLIRFASKFGDYNKEDPESFRLSSNLSLFPQLMFYLRRSQFLQVSRSTPDETAYIRLMLNREGVAGTVIMIQPTLISYTLDGPPMPVVLDISSVKANAILLFDAFFVIVVHYGLTISQWRKLNYHNDPCHDNFKKLLEAPVMDAQLLWAQRNPVPKFIQCDQHSSQARFLLAKLNPSVTHKSEYVGDSELVYTDDVSLQDFIAHLQELAVKDEQL